MSTFVTFIVTLGLFFGTIQENPSVSSDSTQKSITSAVQSVKTSILQGQQQVIDTTFKAQRKQSQEGQPYPHNLTARDGYSEAYVRRTTAPAPIVVRPPKAPESGDPLNL